MALDKRLKDFKSALQRLDEAINKSNEYKDKDEYSFFRDSTIQRFEFTLEIAWKSIKNYLLVKEGIECRSPKSCMREFFSVGYIDETEISSLLEMIDDRNLATHTYHESISEEIFSKMDKYSKLLNKIYKILSEDSI